ncbi:hypothetical protein [Rhizobium laguerreae]|uniref:hypothetical protein n=1 Tax=Rhizobium laguerreae TaxID=1076926 RepID=UPI00143FB801|nr:hypothetical protein [Rhizobium laguerreae]MBY3314671.1 hypothetical protein [Rhizobium laguerreae]NKK58809.1 hypothetical protein [Rhizobium leguminosarum bv. viciae]
MKTIVIEWESINAGEIAQAHFPQPFPMDEAEFEAFDALFSAWERRRWEGIGEMRIGGPGSPAELIEGLRRLGYDIVNTGAVPPGIE